MAKRATGKRGNAGHKKDLTGKKAGKPTKAELRAAAMAVSVNDKKEKLVEAISFIAGKESARKSINADIQAKREEMSALGLTKKGFDFARKLIALDPEDREDILITAGLTLEAAGLGSQGDFFGTDRAEREPGSNSDAFDQNDTAERAGFKAAAEGRGRDANPHAPETAEHEAWDAGWERQTSEHVHSMGPGEGATAH